MLMFVGIGYAQVPEKAQDVSPLLISEQIPGIPMMAMNGDVASLLDIVSEKKTIMLFYRGGWCPYCNAHLSDLGEKEQQIQDLGYQIIAFSPDSPDRLQVSIAEEGLGYTLFSDADGALMKAMGIAFQAPERYNKMLSKHSDDQNPGLLPVPAVFVVDTHGTILFEYISPNYKQRMSGDMLLDVLEHLNKEAE
ncbi:MAG: AhpC/TSA family protein [Bacteroidia bacterium]|nr:AhpC/TSA family protein [Bacteroidia bacterium]